MSKFKVGQQVRILAQSDPIEGFTESETGFVEGIEQGYFDVSVYLGTGRVIRFSDDELEAVDE